MMYPLQMGMWEKVLQKHPKMLVESLSVLFFYCKAHGSLKTNLPTQYFALLTITFVSYSWVEQTSSCLCVTVVLEKVESSEHMLVSFSLSCIVLGDSSLYQAVQLEKLW